MTSFAVEGKTVSGLARDDSEGAAPSEGPIEAGQLTGEQRNTAQLVLDGKNIFITGAAGTGKSFLLRYLIQELEVLYPSKVAVTAPTGIAATNIGGQTIHSFGGVGLGTGSIHELVSKVKSNPGAVYRWKSMRVLVVDEVSMLDADLFEALEAIASFVRGSRAPFGGLQLVLCGDFLQLPPVQERGRSSKRFCFLSECWGRCGLTGGTVILREPVRQAGDSKFAQLLNEVRVGVISARLEDMIKDCNVNIKPLPSDGIEPTKLYCLNVNVDAENAARLARLPGQPIRLRAKDIFKTKDSSQQRLLSGLLDKKVPAELDLKVAAQVILTKNQPALGLVNGSRGIVEDFVDGQPQVRFDNGMSVCIGQERFEVGSSSAKFLRIQVPLKLGWALTVHKAQGMTLTRAELQVADAFEVGQVYVALSRLTSSDGLWIRGAGLSASNTKAHPAVLDYYRFATTPGGAHCAAPVDCKQTQVLTSINAIADVSSNQFSSANRHQLLAKPAASSTGSPHSSHIKRASPVEIARDSIINADNSMVGLGLSVLADKNVSRQPLKRVRQSGGATVVSAPPVSQLQRQQPLVETLQSQASVPTPARSDWVEPPKSWGGLIELD